MNIQFTDWHTIIIGNNEIPEEEFFKTLERNIESGLYDVNYDKETNIFMVCYGSTKKLNVLMNQEEMDNVRDGILSPRARRLMSLSRIQKMIDIQNDNENVSISDILDVDAKKMYLKKLSNDKKLSFEKIKEYFSNLKEDLADAKDYVSEKLNSDEDAAYLWLGLSMLGAIIGVILAATIGGIPEGEFGFYLLWMFGGLLAPLIAFPVVFEFQYIRNRILRMKDNLSEKRLTNMKIKSLEESVETKALPKVEEWVKENSLNNQIPIMLDELADSISEINGMERNELLLKLKEILSKYKALTSNNKLMKDNELCLKNNDLLEKIASLELLVTKVKNSRKVLTRDDEIAYLEEKIDELEKGYTYKKTRKFN